MSSIALQILLLASSYSGAHGHGYLKVPAARTGNDNGVYNPSCGAKKASRATYTGGQVVEFQHTITAHHYGHIEMRINNGSSWRDLIRAEPLSDCIPNDSRTDCQPLDALHPERFYLSPKKTLPQTDKFRYSIPDDLSCDSCVLQWRWWTANTMVGKKDYCCYWNQIKSQGWNEERYHGYFDGCPCGSSQTSNVEQFFGCSDVVVLPGGPTPAPTPAPPTPPTPAPITPVPTPQPTPAPTQAPAQCCTGQGVECPLLFGRVVRRERVQLLGLRWGLVRRPLAGAPSTNACGEPNSYTPGSGASGSRPKSVLLRSRMHRQLRCRGMVRWERGQLRWLRRRLVQPLTG